MCGCSTSDKRNMYITIGVIWIVVGGGLIFFLYSFIAWEVIFIGALFILAGLFCPKKCCKDNETSDV